MTHSDFTESVRIELRRDLAIGRARAEVELADEDRSNVPAGTLRLIANLRFIDKMMAYERVLNGGTEQGLRPADISTEGCENEPTYLAAIGYCRVFLGHAVRY